MRRRRHRRGHYHLGAGVPESGRNWDYRYCWIRDAYYVVRALNRLGAVDILENYLGYLRNLVDQSAGGHVQPVYGVGLEEDIDERIVTSVAGYRGMKPVRVGNQAREHLQHDVYGQIVLPLVQSFYDQRLLRPGTMEDFHALEKVGDRAFAMHDQTDAGLWEFRTIARVHTYSSVMCWAACDRLAKAADKLGLDDRGRFWTRAGADHPHADRGRGLSARGRADFAASFGGTELDASLLQLVDLGFLAPNDPRQVATFDAIERDLKKGRICSATSSPTTSVSRRRRSTSAPSGSSRPCIRTAATRRRARSSKKC